MAFPDATAGPLANIKVTSPAPQITTPLDFALPLASTVRQLKERIMERVEGRPDVAQQRLIYRGKFLRDEQSIGGILEASANGEDPETSDSHTFHLALRPSGSSPTSAPRGLSSFPLDRPLDLNSITTIPTSTPTSTTTTSLSTMAQPVPLPTTAVDRLAVLERQRQSIQEAIGNVRQRLDRINDLTTLASSASRASSAPAVVTRVETRVDYGPSREGGGRVTRTTHTRTTTASVRLSSRSGGVRSVPTSPVGAGGSAGLASNLGGIGVRAVQAQAQAQVTRNISTFSIPDLNNIIAGLQSGTAVGPTTQPLYLLQGPEGQCLLLAGPPSSTPSIPLPSSSPQPIITQIASENHPVIRQVGIDGYLPGESPTDTFSSEASLPGVSPESLTQLLDASYRLGGARAASGIRQTAASSREANSTTLAMEELLVRERAQLRDWVAQQEQRRRNRHQPHQHHHHQRAQQQQMGQVNINIRDLVRRVQGGGAHVWLAVRLVVFVVLFSGGGGWRRRIMLGLFAVVIFLWQTGILEEGINTVRALYRELFPAPVQVPVQLQQQTQQQQVEGGNTAQAQAQANQQLDPAATAQLLVERNNLRRQTRVREVYEMVERVVGLFVTSLVPGVGERQVRAHEERERLRGGVEAVAQGAEAEEEERVRREREVEAQRGMEDAVGGFLAAGL
ncbi:hypothetical protein BGX38DRAFT_873657 [Terfezia claveryi]|nr:hypothetical protein BGX38DRAFT_873657 [Terfezia claveryi]